MSTVDRRYDIDWLRVIAIGLLLIYHVAIGFQPWGMMIGFITNNEPWVSLWIPMAMLNVWRIPLLFFVSGMGVFFAFRHRTWFELLRERSTRILLPFIFGTFVIVPLSTLLWQKYVGLGASYSYQPGHLWFLGNIFVYVLLLSPLLHFLKRHPESKFIRALRALFATPLGLIPGVLVFTLEAMIIKPYPYELYALTPHGFFLGMLAFFFGFIFVLAGDPFWKMITRWRWMFLALAIILFIIRIVYFKMNVPYYLLITESHCWIFSVMAFARQNLNRPGSALTYLSKAAYPVYILHMIWLMLGSMMIFPLHISVQIKFYLLLLFTFVGCFMSYEILRRVPILRMLFGMT